MSSPKSVRTLSRQAAGALKNSFSVLNILLTAFFAIFFIWPPSTLADSGLIINEIMYDLSGTDTNHEWIELYNAGTSGIDLTDWKFNDGDTATNHTLNAPPQNGSRGPMIIPPSGYLILSGNASTTILDLPNYNGSVIDTVMNLSNTGATLKILDKNGTEITPASYTKQMGANGNGKTLSWDGTAFKESAVDGGTPGEKNNFLSETSSPAPSSATPGNTPAQTPNVSSSTSSTTQTTYVNFSDKIFINEFLPAPQSEQNEWVELINLSAETVDLSDWQIDDAPEQSPAQKIPAGTLIKPGQPLVIELNKDIFNNDGDQVRLIWPDDQILHSVSYQNAKPNYSSARFDDGRWLWTEDTTPGQENKKSTPKPQTSPGAPRASVPLIAATSESVKELTAAQKQNVVEQPVKQPETGSLVNQISTPNQILSTKNVTASLPSKGFSNRTFLALAGAIVFSFLSGIGLVSFRKKVRVDNQ